MKVLIYFTLILVLPNVRSYSNEPFANYYSSSYSNREKHNFSICYQMDNKGNFDPNQKYIKTIICGILPDTAKTAVLTILDNSRYSYKINYHRKNNFIHSIKTVPFKKGAFFHFEVLIENPVFVSINGFSGGYTAYKNPANVLFVSWLSNQGVLIEPGDSIHIDGRAGFSAPQCWNITGKGSDKFNCVKDICNKTSSYDNPWRYPLKFDLADSVSSMIEQTISAYKMTNAANSIIRSFLLPVLVPDISEIIVGGGKIGFKGMDISSPKVQRLFFQRASSGIGLIDLKDTMLLYSSQLLDALLVKRFFLMAAMRNENANTGVKYPKKSYFDTIYYNELLRGLPTTRFKQRVLANYLASIIKDNPGKDNVELNYTIKSFANMKPKNTYFHTGILALYEHSSKALSKGSISYPFALPDTTGKIIRMDDFIGKVVVIDFMFTACPACVHMVPFLHKVEKLFSDRNVVFISISVEKSIKNWKKGIGRSSVPGSIQLYTNGEGEYHEIIKHYNIKGFPTLVIIDKNSRIVNANGPDPSVDNGRSLTSLIETALSDN